ncbi:DMT family transporter [Neisseria leonii]|uniref:DMT family transporter n=1 Tax=Neisseria leonii TaxID=2995413 RepID=UPI0030CE6EF7
MNLLPYIALSILGGLIIPLQLAMVNAFRQATLASQLQATFYLYLGGAIASLVLSLAASGSIKPPQVQHAQWWMWLTGFLGSFYILFMFIAAPKIGAANTLLWVFLGQMLFATLLSVTGWFGLPVQRVDWLKLCGLGLVFAGGLLMIYAESR